MTTMTVARSISRPVRKRLHQARFVARVLAVFERACDLITDDGDVLALVTPQIGDGPLNIVVEGEVGLFTGVDARAAVTLEAERLRVGRLTVDLSEAAVWEPRPDWEALRTQSVTLASRLPLLRDLCLGHASDSVLLALLGAPRPNDAFNGAIFTTAQKAVEALRAGWGGDLARLQAGTAELAGLGGGLTPAGDDFLAGMMLWAWLAHSAPGPLCCAIVDAAAPRTTTLSAAFLRAAAQGECSVAWHRLLASLSGGMEGKTAAAVAEILDHGATSGADSLTGFLYFFQITV
jgi:hypothetical protein